MGGPGLGLCTQATPAPAALGLCLPAAALTLAESRGGDRQGLGPFGESGAWWRRPPGGKEVLTGHRLPGRLLRARRGLTPNLFTFAS